MNITEALKSSPKSALKDLIQILHDGRDGFRKSAEHVEDSALKQIFDRYSLQRSKFAGELEAELHYLGDEDAHKEGTTVTGTIHRGWIDLKAALTGDNNHAILAEAERGEDAAVKAYGKALERDDLSASLREIISSQAAEVLLAHSEVMRLRDASKK